MNIRAMVADDEALARDELIYLLKKHKSVNVIAQAANGPETIEKARELSPDLVFLDIQMPGFDGFKVVEGLSRLENPPVVIFVTAYNQYAIEAFKVNAIDYLLKPVEKSRLKDAVGRAMERLRSGRTQEILSTAATLLGRMEGSDEGAPRISIRHAGRYLLVDGRTILYASMKDGLVEVQAEAVKGTASVRSLDELEGALSSPSFFRIHRSYLVNLDHVVEVIPWFSGRLRLRLDDKQGSEVPVSRNRAKILKKKLKL